MLRNATFVLVFLLFALPAGAEQRRDPRNDRGDRIAALADQIEGAAHRAYEGAAHRANRRDRGDRIALQSLRRLDSEARSFERRVDRSRQAVQATREFQELKSALHDAQRQVSRLHARSVEKDVRRVASLVRDLERVYASAARIPRRGGPDQHASARPLLFLLSQVWSR